MIYIYSNIVSPRLQYTCDVIFQFILKVDYSWIKKEEMLTLKEVPIINYSNEVFENSIGIKPHTILYENHIQEQKIAVTHLQGIPCFFKTSDIHSFHYDIFAATFYLISRYEEYLPFTPDIHGRFPATESLAYKANFLHLPVVHEWVNELKNKIELLFPNYHFPKIYYNQLNTIDIDIAYAFRGKPFLRQIGGLLKSLVLWDKQELQMRFSYYFYGKDILDTYDYIENVIQNNQVETIFFFQLGNYGVFDKNIPLKNPLKNLIKRLSKIGKIGIHPSYNSNTDMKALTLEINRLEQVLEHKIFHSRQHFLKLKFPETYENLIKNGISIDYTMGFADQIGFRAGMCVVYPFFNLIKNEQRPLLLLPFQLMEGTLKDYLQLSPHEAMEQVKKIKKTIQEVQGTFVSIFHNSSLSDVGEWKGWREVYEEVVLN